MRTSVPERLTLTPWTWHYPNGTDEPVLRIQSRSKTIFVGPNDMYPLLDALTDVMEARVLCLDERSQGGDAR